MGVQLKWQCSFYTYSPCRDNIHDLILSVDAAEDIGDPPSSKFDRLVGFSEDILDVIDFEGVSTKVTAIAEVNQIDSDLGTLQPDLGLQLR